MMNSTALSTQNDRYDPCGRFYPWQESAWLQLMQQYQQERLGHAFILHAPADCGQLALAQALSRAWLCLDPQAHMMPCSVCKNCQLLAAHTHPDFFLLQAESTTAQYIKVDQVRQLLSKMQHTKVCGRYRIAIIDSLDQLHPAAANSLLKSLEEPAPGTVFLLLAQQMSTVAATIRSRCQVISMLPEACQLTMQQWLSQQLSLPISAAQQLLQAAAGRPLQAIKLAEQDFFAYRGQLLDDLQQLSRGAQQIETYVQQHLSPDAQQINLFLNTWQYIVHELARVASGGSGSWLLHESAAARLVEKAPNVSAVVWLDFAKNLQQAVQWFASPINKSWGLYDLFLKWQKIFA